jgi:hypothetical protein
MIHVHLALVHLQALAIVAILYFARFDAAFLSLRAKQVGGCLLGWQACMPV